MTEFVWVYDDCDMRVKEPLYPSSRGQHAGRNGGVSIEFMTQKERLEAMTCEFCGRLMWGFRQIEEEP